VLIVAQPVLSNELTDRKVLIFSGSHLTCANLQPIVSIPAFIRMAMENTKDFLHTGLESLDEAGGDQYWNCAEHNQLIWKRSQEGLVAEWLRRGLQILAPRFDSGRGLHLFPEITVSVWHSMINFLSVAICSFCTLSATDGFCLNRSACEASC
jgi:hypothetical protein